MAYSNQGKKIKVVEDDDDANHHNQEQVLCHDFWNEAPEELLTEIFARLVDSRLAARASTVCRRWHSSIRQNPSQFIELFKSHHPPEYSLHWAVMFRPKQCSEANTCHVYSDEWLFLHGKLPAKSFDFLPNSSNMHIKASCNDLFLVGGNNNDDEGDLYVCNPITKQFAQLPAGPHLDDAINISGLWRGVLGHAVVGPIRFKVVQIRLFHRYRSLLELDHLIVVVAVFCSVSRKWETRSFHFPGVGFHYLDNIVTIDWVLYWLGELNNGRQILLYLDLEKNKCGTIRIPSFGDPFCQDIIGVIPVSGGSHELRLMQVYECRDWIVYLKVWRLNSNNNDNRNDEGDDYSNWILVHDKRVLAMPENLSETSCSFEEAFVHPTSGDLVLCVWGKNVFEYNLVHSTYKKFAELSKIDSSSSLKPPFLMVSASGSAAGLL